MAGLTAASRTRTPVGTLDARPVRDLSDGLVGPVRRPGRVGDVYFDTFEFPTSTDGFTFDSGLLASDDGGVTWRYVR